MSLSTFLVLAGAVAPTLLAVPITGFVGGRIAALRAAPWATRMAVVLSGVALAVAAVALGLGKTSAPTADNECSEPRQDGIAALMSLFTYPAIAIAGVVGLVMLIADRRSLRLGALAFLTALVAAIIDTLALISAIHYCD